MIVFLRLFTMVGKDQQVGLEAEESVTAYQWLQCVLSAGSGARRQGDQGGQRDAGAV